MSLNCTRQYTLGDNRARTWSLLSREIEIPQTPDIFWIQSQDKHMICGLQDWGDWWLNMGLLWAHQKPGLIEASFAVARRWLPFQVMRHVLPKHIISIYGNTSAHIWVNYNNSLTWIKAIWGWFPLLTMIPVRSQWGRYNLPRHMVFPGTEPYWSIHFLVVISPCFLFSSGLYSW